MVDMAHFAGLVAAGVYPSPLPHAHVVTTTTHKTLRGPRGGMILANDPDLGKKINSAVFPGLQGGPLMHVIAAKAVAFGEALRPEFRAYSRAVVDNARILAADADRAGLRHRHRRHRQPSHAGRPPPQARHRQGGGSQPRPGRITSNKNAIPFDPEKPMVTSGIRLGSPAATSRGFGRDEFREVGEMIGDVLDGLARSNSEGNEAVEREVRAARARALRPFPDLRSSASGTLNALPVLRTRGHPGQGQPPGR